MIYYNDNIYYNEYNECYYNDQKNIAKENYNCNDNFGIKYYKIIKAKIFYN